MYFKHAFRRQMISKFWSDDNEGLTFSPTDCLIAILVQILEHDHVNLEKQNLFTKMGLGLHDYAVACWYSKWHYNVERPETYIKRNIDPNWVTISYRSRIRYNWNNSTLRFHLATLLSGGGFAMLTHLFWRCLCIYWTIAIRTE